MWSGAQRRRIDNVLSMFPGSLIIQRFRASGFRIPPFYFWLQTPETKAAEQKQDHHLYPTAEGWGLSFIEFGRVDFHRYRRQGIDMQID